MTKTKQEEPVRQPNGHAGLDTAAALEHTTEVVGASSKN